jgi:hypothetical protein
MKIVESTNPFWGLIFLAIFLALFILLLRQLFLKGIFHFKLLKTVFPKELEGVNSYISFMSPVNILKLNLSIMFWFWCPIYYRSIPESKLSIDALKYHNELKRGNKKFLFFLLLYIAFILAGIIIFN